MVCVPESWVGLKEVNNESLQLYYKECIIKYYVYIDHNNEECYIKFNKGTVDAIDFETNFKSAATKTN